MSNAKSNHGKILLWICIGSLLLVFSMFGVTLRNKVMQFANRQQSPAPTSPNQGRPGGPTSSPRTSIDTRSTPSAQATGEPTPQVKAPDLAGWARMKAYMGKWSGRIIEGETITLFTFELRGNPSVEGGFVGYSERVAMPFSGPAAGAFNAKGGSNPLATIYASMTPKAVSWTGEPDEKDITFRVEKRVGKEKCPMMSLTLTPFGTQQLLAEWKADGCADGQVLLEKVDK